MKCELIYHPLKFIHPAGTSRGVMHEKMCWILKIHQNGIFGIGEISIIEGLSKEYNTKEVFENHIFHFLNLLEEKKPDYSNLLNTIPSLIEFPSILFAVESTLLDLELGGQQIYFRNEFTKGETRIPINGLIWMGNVEFMQTQIKTKLEEGYQTIKIKIGAIDYKNEIEILKNLRKSYSKSELTIRVDANGAFNYDKIYEILEDLSELEVHSIEQPIACNQHQLMKELCKNTSVPIALDEELIGINSFEEKNNLLRYIEPQFIILKPSLHGGISGVKEWIELAEQLNIGWWITSALESNIGLNVIAQLTGEYKPSIPQGLGTGKLFSNNFPSSLVLSNGFIEYQN